MAVQLSHACEQEAASATSTVSDWQRRAFRAPSEIIPILDALVSELEDAGYTPREVFGARLAVEEAMVNAIKHGHQYDAAKVACLRYRVSSDHLLAEVEDQGPGFDPEGVPDPLDPENLERPCGRGLFLMRRYMTSVQYNARGNCVSLCWQRGA